MKKRFSKFFNNHQQQQQQEQQQVNPTLSEPALLNNINIQNNQASPLSHLENYLKSFYPNANQALPPYKNELPCLGGLVSLHGGFDPLDYIYIFKNEGSREIPQHWHYVGAGLSDIYAPGLWSYILKLNNTNGTGFGLELTFRIKCDSPDDWENNKPPLWPCKIMRNLAKYTVESKNIFHVGDWASWKGPLSGDEENGKDSIIKHMLMTLDPQLRQLETGSGIIDFIQLVGITQEELLAAQEWDANGILEIMKRKVETGGEYLVTDMMRYASIFNIIPDCQDEMDKGIEETGSKLLIIPGKNGYSSKKPIWYIEAEKLENKRQQEVDEDEEDAAASGDDDDDDDDDDEDDEDDDEDEDEEHTIDVVEKEENDEFMRDDEENNNQHDNNNDFHHQQDHEMRTPSRMSYESESALMLENSEIAQRRFYDKIYILLPLESAKLLPIILRRRLARGKIFHFSNLEGKLCITFVPEGYTAQEHMVSRERPYVRHGIMLHIFIPDELRERMLKDVEADFDRKDQLRNLRLPKNYSWFEHNLFITVVKKI